MSCILPRTACETDLHLDDSFDDFCFFSRGEGGGEGIENSRIRLSWTISRVPSKAHLLGQVLALQFDGDPPPPFISHSSPHFPPENCLQIPIKTGTFVRQHLSTPHHAPTRTPLKKASNYSLDKTFSPLPLSRQKPRLPKTLQKRLH